MLIQPGWVQIGCGETGAGGRSQDWSPHDLLFHLGWDLLQFLLEPSRDGKLTTQKKFRFYCGVAVPHVSTGSHMELHFTGPWGRRRRYKRRNGEKKTRGEGTWKSTKHAVTPSTKHDCPLGAGLGELSREGLPWCSVLLSHAWPGAGVWRF